MQSLNRNVALYERALASVPASFPTSLDIMGDTPGLAGVGSYMRAVRGLAKRPKRAVRGVAGAFRMRRRRPSLLARSRPGVARVARAGVAASGLRGMDGFWDSVGDFFGKAGAVKGEIEAKAEKLEMAIKAILVLSGIAAVTGTANLLRR